MKLISIPADKYEDYRLDVIFNGYKWDPQFLDNNTIARHVLILTQQEHEELERLTCCLDAETIAAEQFLLKNPKLAEPLRLPRQLRKELGRMKNYTPERHIRLTRYDFHPVTDGGWAVSEVNSDVPGGFAEASVMPQIAVKYMDGAEYGGEFGRESYGGHGGEPVTHKPCTYEPAAHAGKYTYKDFSEAMTGAVADRVKPGGRIIFIHCTSYSDDRQVMQFLGDKLQAKGYRIIYAAADHLRFSGREANCILDGYEGKADAIIRFTPLEWLIGVKPKHWQGYFDTVTLSCNHPVAVFAQTKRFPLIWDTLEKHGLGFSTWRQLLPETLEVRDARSRDGFLFKPVLGRVGEGISIKEACRDDEYAKIMKEVRRHPKRYLAQKRFDSRALIDEHGESFHVCLGSFGIEGKAAGYYARISKTPRIDSGAADIPVLVERSARIEKGDGSSFLFANRKEEPSPFSIWAPGGARWTDWVRPVPFVSAADVAAAEGTSACFTSDFAASDIYCLTGLPERTAVFADLPGYEGVAEGLSLAGLGFRPVPLYNGTNPPPGAMALVDNRPIEIALVQGASKLSQIRLPDDAPPAFLLDLNRMHRYKMSVSVFDNSWDLYEQDIPSAEYFIKHGIDRIIVRSVTMIQKDLRKILYKFRKKGMKILFTNGFDEPKEVYIRKPLR